jgi:hypothetical protein
MAPDHPSRAFSHDDESHAINAFFRAIGLAGLHGWGLAQGASSQENRMKAVSKILFDELDPAIVWPASEGRTVNQFMAAHCSCDVAQIVVE